jgi:two-component system LytT family response regulator
MKALIVDDERLARKELIDLLKDFEDIEVVAEAQNVDEALKITESFTPDVVFLDIQMPEKDGFQFLDALDSCPFEVVFVTAYDEFALRAFDVNALDYLLKPIDKQRLERVVDRLRKLTKSKSSSSHDQLNNIDDTLSTNDRIFIRDGEKCWFVQLADIEVFESYGNYVRVYFKEFKPLILKSLNLIEDRLDEKKFFRANRKHIVNMDYIVKVESWFNGGFMLYLKNGQEIEVSRRQAIKFKQLMSL